MKTSLLLMGLLLFLIGCTGKPSQSIPDGAVIVEVTSEGFNPSQVTINAGDTVAWVNKDNKAHWPASAQHPTHEGYPEMGGCANSKFDACKGLAEGESFAFQFNQQGEWKYHDHLNCCTNPKFFGTVVVK
ncbi:hypothetical protein HYU11_03495 [Candidatus Woesearchaeota archaeon]|nr:hypothetical protein [Candidatus Woesearchaeota archaeon]